MDEFGILTQSIGFKPQGKSAPMAASKRPTNANTTETLNFSFVSAQNSNSVNGSFRSSDNQKTQNYYGDIFDGPLKNSKQSDGSSFDYDSIFKNLNKPIYDDNDDIFGGMPGLKSWAPVKNNDVFASFKSSSKQTAPFDDLLGDLGRMEKNAVGFDDLMSGFGGRSPLKNGVNLEKSVHQQPAVRSAKLASSLSEDPFLVLESTSSAANTSSGLFSDPLEQFNLFNYSGSTKLDGQSNNGGYDGMDLLDDLSNPTPMNGSPLRTGSNTKGKYSYAGRAQANKTSTKTSGNRSQKKVDTPSRYEENLETADEAWLNSSEIPLFTQPLNASPPSRTPPKRAQVSKADTVKSSGVSLIDELEDFSMGGVRKNSDARPDVRSFEGVENSAAAASAAALKEAMDRAEAKYRHTREVRERQSAQSAGKKEATDPAQGNQQKSEDDLEFFFSMGSRPSSAPRSRPTNLDPVFDTQFHNVGRPEVTRTTSSGTSSSMKKGPSVTNIVDDLSSIFEAGLSSGEFQEVEGESEERRRARLERHQRIQMRVAKAASEKNQRDLQTQQEQEERHRIAETLDGEIKRWAAGKEGNLRALLSSLHCVLGAECGWQPVSLTDMITSSSVKKVYRKANLCVHPDKVQQKGADLRQKYIAEKVFALLMEAWNKFNSEELS